MSVTGLTAAAIRDAVAAGSLSATEVCQAFLDRAHTANSALNAFTLIDAERALASAQRVDAQRSAGTSLGPLAGVPIALKDNLCVRGMRTTAASRILRTYVPPYSARWSSDSRQLALSFSVRRTATSSRWARRRRTRHTGRPEIHGRSTGLLVDRAADRRRQSSASARPGAGF